MKVDCADCHHVALLTPEALLRAGLIPATKVLDLKAASGAAGAGGRGERWFRSIGGVRAPNPPLEAQIQAVSAARRGGRRSGAGLGDYSRRRSPLGLVRPDRDRQARRSYAAAVNEVSVVEFYPAMRVNGRG